jgi:pimeloyl-ACP methyl ester carboxylesterase
MTPDTMTRDLGSTARAPSLAHPARRPLGMLLAGAAFACCVAGSPAARADTSCGGPDDDVSDYQIVDTEVSTVAPNIVRKVTTVQVGSNPLNRFLMYRVSKKIPAKALRGTIVLLPPLASGFQNYEVGDDGNYESSFAAFFAKQNYDVWGYSQRVQGLAAGSCESGAVDCSAMADWGIQTMVDDTTFIREQIEHVHPGERPAVGGLSLGSMATIAVINAHPHDYAGAFLLEGTLFDASPTDRAINAGYCAFWEGQLADGVYYDDEQFPGVKTIAQLASVDPSAASAFLGSPGLTNHQVFVGLFSTPQISPTTPRPGYFMLAGNAQQDEFDFANDQLFRDNVAQFVDYAALRTIRDVNCSLAGDTTFTGNLHKFHGELFVNAGGHGFGPAMLDTVALMPGARAKTNYVAQLGHVDHFFAVNHVELTEQPLLRWLRKDVFGQ